MPPSATLAPPLDRSSNLRRALTLGSIAAFLLIYSAVLYGGLVDGITAEWWTNMAWTIASLAVALRCFATARAEHLRAQRTAWYLFGIAALIWFAGMIWWDYRFLIQRAEFVYPYYYDVLFMTFPLFMVAGTFFYRAHRLSRPLSLIQLANLGIILCTVTIGCVIVLYEPIQRTEQSGFFIGFAIFHAVLHIVATVFALYCLWFHVWKASQPMFLLILASLALHAVADVLYTFELLGEGFDAFNYLNIYWLCAFAFHYMAAFEQRELNRSGSLVEAEEGRAPAPNSAESLTPALCIVVLYVVAFTYRDRLSLEVFGATAAAGLLFAAFLGARAWWSRRYQESLRAQLDIANRELEAQIQERTAELKAAQATLLRQERLAAIGQLTATVSHELRNPLGVLYNSLALVSKLSAPDNRRLHEALSRANRSIGRCDAIIEELLDFSRAHEVNAVAGDLSAWLEHVLDEHALPAGIALIRDIEPGIHTSFDRERLHRAIINLLNNAADALAHDGASGSTVRVHCRETGNAVILIVSDDGPGMSAGTLASIFEPLFSTKGFGVGLGMPIVKQVVELHGGKVAVHSREGHGTLVTVRLPVEPGDTAALAQPGDC